MENKTEPRVVEAVGRSAAGVRSVDIEAAMAAAIGEAEAEAKALWEKADRSTEAGIKKAQADVAAILSPEALLKRRLDARHKIKAIIREKAAEEAAAETERLAAAEKAQSK